MQPLKKRIDKKSPRELPYPHIAARQQPTTASRASPLRPQFPSCSLQPHTRPCSRHTPHGAAYSPLYSLLHFTYKPQGPWRQIERARIRPPAPDSPIDDLTPLRAEASWSAPGQGWWCGEVGPHLDAAVGGVSVEGAPCAPGSWFAPTPGLATVV